ncbi:MAG: winged helix-turn-helix transcriptional regulator [Fusobacteriaceae bacterium]|nr:winged helix-turn-helix transcriptional regulator [Fusobacteriaceae bacterium]
MLGWQTVSKTIENISMEQAGKTLKKEKFIIKEESEYYLLFRRKGAIVTDEGKKASLEAAIIKETSTSIKLQLRYSTLVLFDTGDLKKELEYLSKKILERKNTSFDPITIFKTLGDQTRFNALKLLSEKNRHNNELAKLLHIKPTTMSHHMSKLVDTGIVKMSLGEKNKSIYVLEREKLENILKNCYQEITKVND